MMDVVDGGRFAPARVALERRPDGTLLLRSPVPLAEGFATVDAMLRHWAAAAPDRVFLAERAPHGGWRRVTYAAALDAVRAIGQAVLDRGLSPERPLAILADNGIDHALIALGAMAVGVPAAPVSPAYARPSAEFERLRAVMDVLRPGVLYVADGAALAPALAALRPYGAEIVTSGSPPPDQPATRVADWLATRPTDAVEAAAACVGPGTIAKLLFTSGSTGMPKGVINTHRMLCSNQESMLQAWPFLAARPPVALDWLPWNHTFGSNFVFNLVLRHGGTLHIDDGKPVPALIGRTAANLRDVSPTVYFNVPRGYDLLLRAIEREPDLGAHLFRDLDMAFYAGAALPTSLWRQLEAASGRATGRPVRILSAWGTTETAPLSTLVHFPNDRAGNLGLPVPGTEIKLAPTGGKLEIRVRGPNVTRGYWRRDDLTAALFDDEGFYRSGDGALLADPENPAAGILFDGRIAEDFKLSTGTWVHVGALRVAAIAAGAPVIEDAVVTGHDRSEIGLLVIPSLAGCRSLCPDAGDAPLADLIGRPEVRACLQEKLGAMAKAATGSATRIGRALLLAEPPSIEANEITDKGYINQRAMLTRRAADVTRLYAEPADPAVILLR